MACAAVLIAAGCGESTSKSASVEADADGFGGAGGVGAPGGESPPVGGAGGGGGGGQGGTLSPDAEVAPPTPDALIPTVDAAVTPPTPDAAVPTPDAAVPTPDAAVPTPDAAVTTPDGAVPTPDAAVPAPDAAVPAPDATVVNPDAAPPPIPDAAPPPVPDAAPPPLPDAAPPPVPDAAPLPVAASVALALDPAESAAGEVITATCIVRDTFDAPMAAETTLSVEPPDGVTLDGARLTATRLPVTGPFTVTCRVPGTALSDTAPWAVHAGPPAVARIQASPAVVAPRTPVQVTVTVEDAYGNPTSAPIEYSVVEGTGRVTGAGNDTVTLDGRGPLVVEGRLSGTDVTARFAVALDAEEPALVLESPIPGGFWPRTLTVTGTATDDLGLASLTVDGVGVAAAPDGTFVTVLDLAPGLHVLTVSAADALGRTVTRERAVLVGDFRAPGEWLERALRVGLNPTWFDDDDPVPDDFAAQAAVAFDPAQLQLGLVPMECGGGMVVLSAIRVAERTVDVVPRDGGLDTTLSLTGVEIDYTGQACAIAGPFGCVCQPVLQTATADAILSEGGIDLFADACVIAGTSTPVSTRVVNLDLHLDPAAAQFAPAITARTEQIIAERVSLAYAASLDLSAARIGQSFALPPEVTLPPPQSATLGQESCFTDAVVDAAGAHFDARVRYDAQTAVDLPTGAGALEVAGPLPSTRGPEDVGLAIDLDVLNTLFFDAWRSGAPLAFPGNLAATQVLPTVFVARGDHVDVTLPGLAVAFSVFGRTIDLLMAVVVPAVVVEREGVVGLQLTDDPAAVLTFAEVVAPLDLGPNESFVRAAAVDALRRDALPSLLGSLIPLPFDRVGATPIVGAVGTLSGDAIHIVGEIGLPAP
jgi:hypothetical protein